MVRRYLRAEVDISCGTEESSEKELAKIRSAIENLYPNREFSGDIMVELIEACYPTTDDAE